NLTQILHPNGTTTTTFQFDMAGRQTGIVDPDLGTESYQYDADGNLTQSIDARGVSVFAAYDPLDRPKWRNTVNAPPGAFATYAYGAQGWLNSVGTQAGTLMNGIGFTGVGGAAGLITGATLAPGSPSAYLYSATYDLLGRATDLRVSLQQSVLFEQTRSFDAAGNVSTANTTLSTGTDHQAFCYDEQNRLTAASSSGTVPCQTFSPGTLTAANYNQSFSYDTMGRLATGPGGAYTYGDPAHVHAATSIGGSYTAAYYAPSDM